MNQATEIQSVEPKFKSDVTFEGPVKDEQSRRRVDRLVLALLCVVSVLLHLAFISRPREVVFDEVHFGGFATNYVKREYFFDVHPPLVKMIYAGVAALFGYAGHFTFDKISLPYSWDIPFVQMRAVNAICGSAISPLVFMIMREEGFSMVASFVGGALILFDNATTTLTRFILLDGFLLFFMMASYYSWTRYTRNEESAGWLVATGVFIGCCLSSKIVGVLTPLTIGMSVIKRLHVFADVKTGNSLRVVGRRFVRQFCCLAILPLAMYVFSYVPHLLVLNKSGKGDAFMTPEFQADLVNSPLYTASQYVFYGSEISLKNKAEDRYLRSSGQKYPHYHSDGKVSSQGQVVSGFVEADDNSQWIILPESGDVPDEPTIVKNEDKIMLMHKVTGKCLLTHDVASALTRTHQEVTVGDCKSEDKKAKMTWTVRAKNGGDTIKTKVSIFRLENVNKPVFLLNFMENLPRWGQSQREINAIRNKVTPNAFWTVDTIVSPFLNEAPKAPEKPKSLTFFQKFIEIQKIAIRVNSRLMDKNPAATNPASWPLLTRGLSFWENGKFQRIYLLGNPITWIVGFASIVLYAAIAALEYVLHLRGFEMFTPENRSMFYNSGGFYWISWAMHYLPFFLMDRALYLHHYIPPLLFSTLVAAVLFQTVISPVFRRVGPVLPHFIAFTVVASAAYCFYYFSPLTYGLPVEPETMRAMKWFNTWEFI